MFGLDGTQTISLPGIAQLAMWKNYDPLSPLVYTFSHRFNAIRTVIRDKLTGGLCNVFHVSINVRFLI